MSTMNSIIDDQEEQLPILKMYIKSFKKIVEKFKTNISASINEKDTV